MPYLCLHQEGIDSLPRLLEKAQQNGYSVVTTSINNADIPLEFERAPMSQNHEEFTYSDLTLQAEQWNSKVILILSDTECDSDNAVVRENSEKVLQRDLSWAEHLQYAGYVLLRLKSENNVNLARLVTSKVKGAILVHVPLYNKQVAQAVWRRDIDEAYLSQLEEQNDSWHWWNSFRWSADFHAKLKVVLELNADEYPSDAVVTRWLGEPLEAVIVPANMFIRNSVNYPVLPKMWQTVLKRFVGMHVNIILTAGTDDNSLKHYGEYLTKFLETHQDQHLLHNFEDILEIPLQPLYDNLDCYTYEVFEKDPVKYKLYQTALEKALVDRVTETEMHKKVTVVMVLGAGRGPLVRAALNAAEKTQRKIRVYIIEKNPNAVRTLRGVARKLWQNKDVHIFSKDMREFTPPEQADILVSELLGSFGDNELSPECLDCAQNLLKPDGISIPCKSISYINPLMSAKLYNAVRQIQRHEPCGRDKQSTYNTYAESGFVVLLKNIYSIDETQPLFEFVHPNRQQTNGDTGDAQLANTNDNRRYKRLCFNVDMDCVLNGIGGYFECVLYKDIMLSINPPTHTVGMASWFPMYFPFTEPQQLKKGQTVEIHFWRCVSKQKIWYEWCLAKPFRTHIHNHNGRACPIYCT